MDINRGVKTCTASLLAILIVSSLSHLFPTPAALAFSFYTAINLSDNDGDSSRQRVAASGSNVYVVWDDGIDNPGGVQDIFFSRSTDGGASFETAINLTFNDGFSTDPLIFASGSNVYVVWHDDTDNPGVTDVLFARSADGGASFDASINVSASAIDPPEKARMAVSGTNIYITWQQAGDVYFAASNNAGISFGAPTPLSSTGNIFIPHSIAASGNNVYVAWSDDTSTPSGSTDIFVASSTDGGSTFGLSVNASENDGASSSTSMAASGNDLYLVWVDNTSTPSGSTDIFFSKSVDNGATFSAGIPIENTDGSSSLPDMMISGSNTYVVWQDNDTSSIPDILFARSADGGASFDDMIPITTNDGFSQNPQVLASESNVFVVWDDDTDSPGKEVFFSGSTNNGATFGSPINLSDSPPSSQPRIAVSGNSLYITWRDISGFAPNIFVRVVEDTGPPSITMNTPSSTAPKWGLNSVQVSGTANADNTDTVTIDWGDGTSTTGIAISGSAWGPESHTYDSAHTGNNSVVAKLIDQFGAERITSSAQTINVQKHATALTINPIMSVIKGSDVTATGTLTDTDASVSLNGKTISFTGTGALNLASVATASGLYSSTGASPGTASPLQTVQAHFAGDSAYLATDSVTISYDTIEPGTMTFVVPAGTPSGPITLTGFGASILFDNVAAPGSIFVSACDSPTSARYAELVSDTCIQISSAVEMASNTAAHITISFDGKTLPPGRTAEEIGVFRESLAGITEITESRDLIAKTVTGKTTGFSRFIVGVALHTATPAGAKAEQVFVGNNDVSLDFTESRAISLSTNSIPIGHAATVSVTDPLANLNSSVKETVTATVTSTSDPTGITVILQETGSNTGIFSGLFTVTNNPSSGTMLHAANGNSINASYQAMTTAPFRVVLTDVSEAGLAEVVSFDAPDSVIPVGDAYALSLKDAQLSGSSTITLTMSYTNAVFLGSDDLAELRIVRVDGTTCVEVVTPTLDVVQKTVTGTISTLGYYTIAFPSGSAPNTCPGVPGGGGGGLPRPGSGLVLDAVAAVITTSSGGGSSGSSASSGSSSSGASSPQVSSNNASTTTNIGGETVSVDFESVEGTGSVSVTSMSVTQQAGLFSQVTGTGQGTGSVGGSQFSTAGTLFDVSTSASYSGPVQITIPYNESFVTDEQNVRFMHHGPDGWEDATISINTQSNTVTGQVTSLSPVVAGVVDDGTFGETYFVANPTKRMAVMDAQTLDEIGDRALTSTTEAQTQKSMQATIKNSQRANQTFAFIVQVIDENGFTQDVSWQTGELGTGESIIVSSNWAGLQGAYRIEMFVWTDISSPAALSEVVVRNVVV